MKAWIVHEDGPRVVDLPIPRPGEGQLLVRVHAAALNRVDHAMAAGKSYGTTGGPGTILGRECAGVVVETGPGVSDAKPGDPFMASTTGAFAQFALVDHRRAYAVPTGLSFCKAAALPVSLSTMHNAVLTVGGLIPGQTVLVRGASTAVGLMAMQIAKLKGAHLVIGTSTDEDRRSHLAAFGADLALDTGDPGWVDIILQATGGHGVDLVIDQLAGPALNECMLATKVGGRIVNVGRLAGETAPVDMDLHALRRIGYLGVTFRTRTREEIHAISADVRADLWDAIASGALSMPLARTFGFGEIQNGLSYMVDGRHFGKIVITF